MACGQRAESHIPTSGRSAVGVPASLRQRARDARRAADALTATGGTVLILSALHGLTPLGRVTAPYELRMGQPGAVTPEWLAEQARALGVDQVADVVILAGAA